MFECSQSLNRPCEKKTKTKFKKDKFMEANLNLWAREGGEIGIEGGGELKYIQLPSLLFHFSCLISIPLDLR